MTTQVKICGLKTPDAVTAALEGGADFVGLVFHPTSPRHVEIEVAAYLASYVPAHLKICGLFVDPTDQKLGEILSNVRLDMIQLHGSETFERAAQIKATTGKPIIKALPIASNHDVAKAYEWQEVADWLLLDTPGGGTGHSFDWSLLDTFKSSIPWMLAGGLTAETVGEAIARLRPDAVDVSSGVEATRGVKDPGKIHDFIRAAKTS